MFSLGPKSRPHDQHIYDTKTYRLPTGGLRTAPCTPLAPKWESHPRYSNIDEAEAHRLRTKGLQTAPPLTPHLSLLILSLLLLLNSCSGTKYLAEDQLLYSKTELEFAEPAHPNAPKNIESDLYYQVSPQPNTGFNKFRQWVYLAMGQPKKERSPRAWLKNNLGVAPTYYQPDAIERSRLAMTKYLFDHGYFKAKVETDSAVKEQQVTVTYLINTGGRTRIRSIEYPQDSTDISQLFRNSKSESDLKGETFYARTNLDAERARLATVATDTGYYDFSFNYIYYFIDTTVAPLTADIFLRVQPPENAPEHQRYRIGETSVLPNYDLQKTPQAQDTFQYGRLTFIQDEEVIRPRVLERMVVMKEGDLYSGRFEDYTVNHLLDLGVFKFVNLDHEKVPGDTINRLNRTFQLTPGLTQTFSASLQLSNRSGNYLGTIAGVAYTNKNFLGGAEQFSVSLSGGVETQLGDTLSFINTADLNLETSLSFPRFIAPFIDNNRPSLFIPRTIARLGTNFQRRSGFYTISSVNLRFGYDWRENQKKRHQLNPIYVSQVRVFRKTPEFEELLADNPRLAISFQNYFITGLTYTYTRTTQSLGGRDPYSYINADFETAGNLASLFTLGQSPDGDSREIFNTPFAQYGRVNLDVRRYFPQGAKMLATRIVTGIGLPYGNSDVIPYAKQFFAGGANSVRAFRLRELGPGSTERIRDPDNPNPFIDRTGDVLLEGSVEYRFPLVGYFKGAVFLDAGNVWVLDKRGDAPPEGVFEFSDFYREIALGTGFGLRLDLQFFVIRLDAAFALRDPALPESERWLFNELDPLSRSWRRDHLRFNLAIGYPF